MQAFSAAQLLSIWESCGELRGRQRSAALLQRVSPDGPEVDLCAWTLGQWNAALLDLREAIFGPQLALTLPCPDCRERLELDVSLEALRMGPTDARELSANVDDWQVRFRLPTIADIEAVSSTATASEAALEDQLLSRCLLHAACAGAERDTAALPAEVRARIDAVMSAADPQGGGLIEVGCSACEQTTTVALDLGALLWQELDAWAHHILSEVHVLASVYGWREADVLGLSARRRSAYLQLIAS
jgi:hypothetical protein